MREYRLSRLEQNDFVVWADSMERKVEVFHSLRRSSRFVGHRAPHYFCIFFAVEIEYFLVARGRLFTEIPFPQSYVVATRCQVLTVKRFNNDRPRFHVF